MLRGCSRTLKTPNSPPLTANDDKNGGIKQATLGSLWLISAPLFLRLVSASDLPTFRLKSLRTSMKYLSNSIGRIPALKKWDFTIDVGPQCFTSSIRLWFFHFWLLPIYFINLSNIYQSPLFVSKSVDKQRCPFWPGKLNVKVWPQAKVKVNVTKKMVMLHIGEHVFMRHIGPDYIAVAWI